MKFCCVHPAVDITRAMTLDMKNLIKNTVNMYIY